MDDVLVLRRHLRQGGGQLVRPREGDGVGDQADDGGVAAGLGGQRPARLAEYLHGVPEGVGDAD
ncbi:MAG: hypothetical protein ACKV19_24540 [Verrucomicrobiales bacterium]